MVKLNTLDEGTIFLVPDITELVLLDREPVWREKLALVPRSQAQEQVARIQAPILQPKAPRVLEVAGLHLFPFFALIQAHAPRARRRVQLKTHVRRGRLWAVTLHCPLNRLLRALLARSLLAQQLPHIVFVARLLVAGVDLHGAIFFDGARLFFNAFFLPEPVLDDIIIDCLRQLRL